MFMHIKQMDITMNRETILSWQALSTERTHSFVTKKLMSWMKFMVMNAMSRNLYHELSFLHRMAARRNGPNDGQSRNPSLKSTIIQTIPFLHRNQVDGMHAVHVSLTEVWMQPVSFKRDYEGTAILMDDAAILPWKALRSSVQKGF